MPVDYATTLRPRWPSRRRRPRQSLLGSRSPSRASLVAALIIGLSGSGGFLRAQEIGRTARESGEAEQRTYYQRKVQVPQHATLPAVVMTEFFTHGELDERAESLAVYDGRHEPVSWRILQVGPGDYCRIAFQTTPKQHLYKIYYGGKAEARKPPAWTSTAGLLLETRRWTSCDLNSLASVQAALQASSPYGSAFVPSVFHRYNPFLARPGAVPERIPRDPPHQQARPLSLLHFEPGRQLPPDR